LYKRIAVVQLREGQDMAKSVSQAMEELRQELTRMKQRVEQQRVEGGDPSNIAMLQRWITDGDAVLARWDSAA